jgi:KDO2-lipid IV(A) lauroyltransferase
MKESKAQRSSPLLATLAVLSIRLAGALPLPLARGLGAWLVGLAAHLPTEERAVSNLNLELCFPDLGDMDRRDLVRASLRHTGRTVFELAHLWQRPLDSLRALEGELIGGEHLERALASDRGALLLLPHLGNWEVLNHFLARRARLASLYREPRLKELDAYLLRRRQRTGIVMAPPTSSGLRTLLKTLKEGGAVLILPDQEPLKQHGVWAPFFGTPALTMTLATRLLKSSGATPLMGVAEREQDGRFTFRISPPAEDLASGSEEESAAALNRSIEACVRRRPEQYLWSYKRFKTAPPGEPTPYRAIWSRRRLRRNPFPPA